MTATAVTWNVEHGRTDATKNLYHPAVSKRLITTAVKLTIKLKNYCSYNTHPANVAQHLQGACCSCTNF